MKTILATFLLSLTLITNGIAQKISSDAYNHSEILEDFNQEGNLFPIINTTENQFIINNGDYFLIRNNKAGQYIITANKSSFSDFILKTSIRIGPSNNKNASIGIILKAQQKGEGAIIFEINKTGEYRIKQLLNNTYKILNTNFNNEGWVKSKIINRLDEHNIIEIRTENNIFDVYINNNYLTTFFNQDYTNGSCGLIISPGTKARVAYYYIDTKGENSTSKTTYTSENTSNTNTEIKELNRKIVTLEANNTKLNLLSNEGKENQRLELKSLRKKENEQAEISIKQEKEIESLNRTIADFKNNNLEVDKLENITLINNLTSEKSKLITEVSQLTETTNTLNTKNADLATLTNEQEKKIISLNRTIADLKNNKLEVEKLENTTLINNLTIEKSELLTEVSQLTETNNSLNTKNADLVASTNEQEKEIVSLKSTITDLKSKSTSASSTNNQQTKKIEALKQKITIEKSVNTSLTNDLNNVNKSSDSEITKLDKEVILLKTQINTTTNINTTLSANLSAEEIAHSNTKNSLSNTVINKNAEIKALEAQLNTTQQELKSASKNAALAKECAENEATLTAEIKNAKQEISNLQSIKTKQDDIVNNLNSQLSLLKAKQIDLKTEVQALNKKTSNLETTNIELKELFILKDFEANSVKPFDLIKKTNAYSSPKDLQGNSTIYAIQFGVFMQVQAYSTLKVLDEVWYEKTEHGTYVYLSGQFKNPQDATAHKNKVAALGYTNAFVVTLRK